MPTCTAVPPAHGRVDAPSGSRWKRPTHLEGGGGWGADGCQTLKAGTEALLWLSLPPEQLELWAPSTSHDQARRQGRRRPKHHLAQKHGRAGKLLKQEYQRDRSPQSIESEQKAAAMTSNNFCSPGKCICSHCILSFWEQFKLVHFTQ